MSVMPTTETAPRSYMSLLALWELPKKPCGLTQAPGWKDGRQVHMRLR